MGAAAICIVTMHFIWYGCFPYRGNNIPTKFVDNRSNDKRIEILLLSQDGGDHHVEFWLLGLFDSMYVFCIKVAISLLNLALISRILKKLQTLTEIDDGGVGHFEFEQLCIFNVIDVFLIEVPMFPLSLAKSEDRSNSEEMATVFRNSRWRRLHLELRLLNFSTTPMC